MEASKLRKIGIPEKEWVTLENSFNMVGMYADNNIYVSPTNLQFYFDSDDEVILLRKTTGKNRKYKNETLKSNEVIVYHDGEPYVLTLERGGVEDSDAGIYHDAVSYDAICGFYN